MSLPCLQVITNESRSSPFILFIKDAEKSLVGNSESYSTFKSRLEKLPDNVVVIGSQVQNDNRKEKVLLISFMFLTFYHVPGLLLGCVMFLKSFFFVGTSWWFIFHKVWQQSNCSVGPGFSSKVSFLFFIQFIALNFLCLFFFKIKKGREKQR